MAIDWEQEVEVTLMSRTRKYYSTMGYVFNKQQKTLMVKAKDLPKKSHTKIITICDVCGDIKTTSVTNCKQGNHYNCQICSVKQISKDRIIPTETIMKNFTIKTKMNAIDISGYGVHSIISFKAQCGHIETINYRSAMQNGVNGLCTKCYQRNINKELKLSINDVTKIFSDNGCELLSKEYNGYHSSIQYKCECGNISTTTLAAFKIGKRCGCKRQVGKDHYNYNHELTDNERLLKRQFPEYQQWRNDVFNKDKYACVCCGQRGGDLQAHHVLNYSKYTKLRLELSNGVTLCNCCHRSYHMIYGNKDNNQLQLTEFIEMNKECRADKLKDAI